MVWNELDSLESIEKLIQDRSNKKIAVYKHSTKCYISQLALSKLEHEIDKLELGDIDFYFLDILRFRDISNRISELLKVQHESPQLILFQNGKALYNASHSEISLSNILNY